MKRPEILLAEVSVTWMNGCRLFNGYGAQSNKVTCLHSR